MKLPPHKKNIRRARSFPCCARSPTTRSSGESITTIPRRRCPMFAARKMKRPAKNEDLPGCPETALLLDVGHVDLGHHVAEKFLPITDGRVREYDEFHLFGQKGGQDLLGAAAEGS